MNRRVGVVARREFLTTVRRKAYLIATFGMPLFLILYGAVAAVPALIMAKKEAALRTVGLVDLSGRLGVEKEIEWAPPDRSAAIDDLFPRELAGKKGGEAIEQALRTAGRIRLRPFPSAAAATTALRKGEIASFYEVAADWLVSGRAVRYQKEANLLTGKGSTQESTLGRFAVEKILAGRLDPALIERVRRPFRFETRTLAPDGTFVKEDLRRQIGSFIVPLVFAILFFISVMMSSGFLLQGVSEEKENRVIEVILSSIDADGLLLGKLIGLGAAGLLQVVIWFGLVLIPAASILVSIRVAPLAIAGSVLFYLLGFLLFGVLLTGTGSLGQNLKESQQYGMIWSLGSAIPMMFIVLLLGEPNGLLARILSFIPLTAPVTMFMRLSSSQPPPWWEVLLAAAVLAAAVWISLKAMARIFRVGLLLYGKRPTVPEILRLMRRPPA